jgi:hypothetical protein
MKKKSVEMRALKMAVEHMWMKIDCPDCVAHCDGMAYSRKHCHKTIAAHFLSLAKKEMDKEKK